MSRYGERKPFPFWAKCLIVLVIEAVIAVAILASRGVFEGGMSDEDLFKHLTDAFFVPSILVLCFAMLAVVTAAGSFDALKWGMTSAVKALIPGGRLGKFENYGDYVMRKRGERKKGGLGFLFVAGGIVMAASMICMILYFQAAS